LAVFDLDNTLFDLSRRERVARRQGLKPKSKKWFEFLNQNQYVLMDTAIPGTTNFVRGLSKSGYTIAYLSGRPRSVLAATKKSLQQAGFPIDALQEDLIFLHSGNPSKQNLIKHKLNVLTHLKSKFDVDFFFDDTPEFRDAAKSLFIPGVYPSISAYTGNDNPRSNPMMSSASSTHAYEQPPLPNGAFDRLKKKVQNYVKDRRIRREGYEPVGSYRMPPSAFSTTPEIIQQRREIRAADRAFIDSLPDPVQNYWEDTDIVEFEAKELERRTQAYREKTELERDLNSLENIIRWGNLIEDGLSSEAAEKVVYGEDGMRSNPPTPRPPPKPRKKRDKAGRMRKEPSKKYIRRVMEDPKMNSNFPNSKQRYAVAMTYAAKFYGNKIFSNPPVAYDKDGNPTQLPSEEAQDMRTVLKAQAEADAIRLKAEAEAAFMDRFGTDMEGFKTQEEEVEEESDEESQKTHRQAVEEELGISFTNTDDVINALRRFSPDGDSTEEEEWRLFNILQQHKEYPKSNPLPKPRKKRSKNGSMRKEPLKKYIERFMGNKKMNEEFPDRAQRFAVGLSYAREFYGNSTVDRNYPPRDVVRTNPGTVAEAKEMYKQFHQKNPSSVKKQKIDFGDTWIGLGKAWSIGYRSGKETGDNKQKYIHNFGVDEESGKKFKEPDLYYVKNKDGSQMMVIMGGDWYIDVDSDGKVSWIYI
jgi:hypothetical protein